MLDLLVCHTQEVLTVGTRSRYENQRFSKCKDFLNPFSLGDWLRKLILSGVCLDVVLGRKVQLVRKNKVCH